MLSSRSLANEQTVAVHALCNAIFNSDLEELKKVVTSHPQCIQDSFAIHSVSLLSTAIIHLVDPQVIEFLISKLDVNLQMNDEGLTALMHACYLASETSRLIIEMLVKNPAIKFDLKDRLGRTALDHAREMNNTVAADIITTNKTMQSFGPISRNPSTYFSLLPRDVVTYVLEPFILGRKP